MANFKTKVVAKIKGDEAEAAAVKIESRAKAALNGQIAALESKKVEAEIKLDDARNALDDAKFPAALYDSTTYIHGIKTAQAALDFAEEGVETINESIEYYKKLKEELFA